MSTLTVNVPPYKCWVWKHALRNYTDQQDKWTLGYLVSAKSIPGRAFYFQVYLPQYGAMYDKLTIDALRVWDPDYPDAPNITQPPSNIEDLQFWDCFDYGVTVTELNLIGNMTFEVRPRSGKTLVGKYIFTLDSYHPHRNEPDFYFSEVPDEHKSHHFVELDSGELGLYPNNRCRMVDPSLSYAKLETPDFKVATRYVDVEHAPNWGRLGECDDYFWTTPEEREGLSSSDEYVTTHSDEDPEEPQEHTRWKEIQENPW
tara:strand:+ start:3315 stop:4088 length:774 start_codon:yes stop_codon:yes gene_type:complete